jgi:hypothetical protein
MIFAGFIAAGFILSVNLDVIGLLYALRGRRTIISSSRKVFGTVIFACVGLTLYIITRYSAHIRELRTRLCRPRSAPAASPCTIQLTGLPNRRHLKGVLNWLLSESGDSAALASSCSTSTASARSTTRNTSGRRRSPDEYRQACSTCAPVLKGLWRALSPMISSS